MTDAILSVTDDAIVDLRLSGNDLETDATLRTAVLISLFSDGRADLEDELPGADDDRRGWWAGNLTEDDLGSFFGSRLWLLSRAKLSNQTLAEAEEYAKEALEWLETEGIVESVEATASRLDGSILLLEITITRGTATEFADAWEAFADLELGTGSVSVKLLAR